MVKSCVKDVILNEMKSTLYLPRGTDSIFHQLYDLLLNTVENGEGNSVLLVGPRGSGKTSLMNYTMNRINIDCENKFILIYLSGYVCVDDQQALKEIAKHLCPDKELPDLNINSFSSTMTFLLETLNSGDSERQSIIFVLDEFDLFTQHHNQHLLYNLFDLSQSKSTPIAVVGLTCRQDIMELMEKRVKSRFSHRQFFMYGPSTFDEYNEIVIEILCPNSVTCKKWKNHVIATLNDDTNKLKTYLERLYNFTRSIKVLKNYLTWVIINLSSDPPKLDVELFEEKLMEAFKDAKAVLIKSLSKLECCILISMARLSTKHANQPFNLEMVLHEYKEFVTFEGKKIDEIPNHSLAVKAIEKMITAQLVRTLSSRQSKVQKDYKLMYLNIDIMDLINIIKSCTLPSNVQKWAQYVLTF